MNIEDLGKFRVNGSIDTQWRTNLAVERILIASGKKVSGITSILTTLEFIGSILTIILSAFIIVTLLTIHFLLFLVRIYKWVRYSPAMHSNETYTGIPLDTELTDEDIAQMEAMDTEDYLPIESSMLEELRQALDGSDFFGPTFDKLESLLDCHFVYDKRTEKLIFAYTVYGFGRKREFELKNMTRFRVIDLPLSSVNKCFNLHKDSLSVSREEFNRWDITVQIHELRTTTGCFEFDEYEGDLTTSELISYLNNISQL